MRHARSASAVLLFLAASAAVAQERPLEPGERVRLKAPRVREHSIQGRVVEVQATAVIVDAEAKPSFWERAFDIPVPGDPPGRFRVPLDAVTSLEVARGKKSNWPAALGTGLLVGAGTVLLAGAAGSNHVCLTEDDPACSAKPLVIGAVAVAAATTVGFGLFAKGDRWVDVTPAKTRMTVTAARGRGVAVAVSVGF